MLSRRRFPLVLAAAAQAAPAGVRLTPADIRRAPSRAVAEEGAALRIHRSWTGDVCRSRVTNHGRGPVRIREIVLFAIAHQLPGDTALYGESFQMLSQTAGTLAAPLDLSYSEQKHYKIPVPEGVLKAPSGVITLSPSGGPHLLLGFTSCRRFLGKFYIRPGSIEVVVDTEGLELAAGESCELEEFTTCEGADRAALLQSLAAGIRRHHPPLAFPKPPTGWCSWYCFGPRVTAQNVLDNLDAIAGRYPGLKYVQIDDGYQPAMGDWLETGKAFGGDLQGVLQEIRRRGFEPAIWVAPFIAEAGSHLFQQHPDWFIQDGEGRPLPSDKVTFGGWRHGPWYALDGTHPGVQKHFEDLFRTMRRQWGCTYFKLDANFWGAMHGGRFHDPRATRIEAYRRGMQAILRGAGDSFILGCNHPIWPSFGLIHGSRSSGDVSRKWPTIRKIARENLNRNWQNGTLWWNDPDAVVLTGALPDHEFQFHATAVYACGGMILSGDDLTRIPPERAAMLRKLLPPTGVAARFEDASLSIGVTQLPDSRMVSLFNWTEAPQALRLRLPHANLITDFWSGADLGRHEGVFEVPNLPPHSARLLACRAAG